MQELRQDNLRPHQKRKRLLMAEDARGCSSSDLFKPCLSIHSSFIHSVCAQHTLSNRSHSVICKLVLSDPFFLKNFLPGDRDQERKLMTGTEWGVLGWSEVLGTMGNQKED